MGARDDVLEIGEHGLIFDGAIVQLQGGAIRASDHVQIRTWCVVKSLAELTLGSRAILGYGAALHCAERIEIGELVGIAERVTLVDSDHALDGSDRYFHDAPVLAAPIVIGRNAFIATGAVVGRGVTIGPNAAVGANAVVTAGDYAGGMLIAGVPARRSSRSARLRRRSTARRHRGRRGRGGERPPASAQVVQHLAQQRALHRHRQRSGDHAERDELAERHAERASPPPASARDASTTATAGTTGATARAAWVRTEKPGNSRWTKYVRTSSETSVITAIPAARPFMS